MSDSTQAAQLDTANWPSVNALTNPLVAHLVANAKALRVGVTKSDNGATIIDAGIKHAGGLEAGRLIAEICMGGLGHVNIQSSTTFPHWPWMQMLLAWCWRVIMRHPLRSLKRYLETQVLRLKT